jgi:aspartate-semialdehyde dehydrogenase
LIRVGILGATGAVGQQFIRFLQGHPWFRITALAASERSAGKAYAEAANWLGSEPIPDEIASMEVLVARPDLPCDIVFSGLDAGVAGEIEGAFASAGYPVISNARNYRMEPDVPLLIPEVNPGHAALISRQKWGNGGFIVTNPNCSTVGLVCALKPLQDAFGIEAVQVTTMQALSGAGYPGVASLDALGNVVPFIGGEEQKMAAEPKKLLGTLGEKGVELADIRVSASCNRVPVIDGHLASVALRFGRRVEVAEVIAALENYDNPVGRYNLPSSPEHFLRVFSEDRFPQPRLHAGLGRGMTVSVGRVRPCEVLDIKMSVLVHNTIRGAAGGAVLNAEYLVATGYIPGGEKVGARGGVSAEASVS